MPSTIQLVALHAVPGEDLVTLSAPSMGDGPSAGGTCASDCEIRQLESAQLPRICDVADPKVDVLFVSPVPLSEEVERYWNLVLAQVGGTSQCHHDLSRGVWTLLCML